TPMQPVERQQEYKAQVDPCKHAADELHGRVNRQAGLEGESDLAADSLSSIPSRMPRRNSPTAFPSALPTSGNLPGPKRIRITTKSTTSSASPMFPIIVSFYCRRL